MRYGSLDGAAAKVRRAAEHYGVAKYELSRGVDKTLRALTPEVHRGGLEYRLHVGDLEPIDPSLVLVLGDGFHNLRCALDYLVFELHVRSSRGNMCAQAVRDSQFPIFNDVPMIGQGSRRRPKRTDEWARIKRLGMKERTAIEFMQPYHRWDRRGSLPGRPYPIVHQYRGTLDVLGWFDIVDKHHNLHLAHTGAVSVTRPSFSPSYGFRQNPEFGVPLVSHAKVDTWTFRRPPPFEQVNMQADCYTAVAVEKGPGDRIPIIGHLGSAIQGVALILARFERLFPPVENPVDLSWVRETLEQPRWAGGGIKGPTKPWFPFQFVNN